MCMFPHRNWDPPPSPASECVPPPGTKGALAHSPVGDGVEGEGPNSDDWRKSLALCLLCALINCKTTRLPISLHICH